MYELNKVSIPMRCWKNSPKVTGVVPVFKNVSHIVSDQ